MNNMEHKIGEKFKYKGVTLEVVKSHKNHPLYPCCDCYFLTSGRCYKSMYKTGKCSNRGDKIEVYFKEIQNMERKVGEQFKYGDKTLKVL